MPNEHINESVEVLKIQFHFFQLILINEPTTGV